MTGSPRGADRTWLTDDEQRMWRAYLAASRLLEDSLDADLQEYGLTLGEYEILALLSEAPDRRLRMSALASTVIRSRSNVTHTAARLEKRGLLERLRAPGDRRGVEAHLTSEGLALVEVVAPHHVGSVRRHFLAHLGPAGVTPFRHAMEAVRDGILADADDHPASARPNL